MFTLNNNQSTPANIKVDAEIFDFKRRGFFLPFFLFLSYRNVCYTSSPKRALIYIKKKHFEEQKGIMLNCCNALWPHPLVHEEEAVEYYRKAQITLISGNLLSVVTASLGKLLRS